MRDDADVAVVIERIVTCARVPGQARRDDLRRELWTHFEEVGGSIDATREALRRFGADAEIGESLRRVYHWEYALWYSARIAASIVASLAAALLIQVAVNLRLELQAEVWRLAPGFSRAAGMSVAVVLGLITLWEAARPPVSRSRAVVAIAACGALGVIVRVLFPAGVGVLVTATILVGIGFVCSRLARWTSRVVALVGAFATTLYVNHLLLRATFGPSRALMAGLILWAVWSSTVAILSRLDRAFGGVFEP
jgi:hypothetical protein